MTAMSMQIDSAILHVMTPTGQIIELGKQRERYEQGQEFSLAAIISMTETLTLVHSLDLKLVQLVIPFLNQDLETALPNDLQIIINKPENGSFKTHRGMSSLVYSRDMIPDTVTTLLQQISHYYEGCRQRIQEGLIAEKHSRVIEEELVSLFNAKLFGKLPTTQRKDLTSIFDDQMDKLAKPAFFGISYELIGFISFNEVAIRNIASCRKHEFDADSFSECPFCGSAIEMIKPPRIIFNGLSFACKSGYLKPSDVLRFVAPWPKLGEQIVIALVNRGIWTIDAIKTVLFPAKMIFKLDNNYIATIWQITRSNLGIAVLTEVKQNTTSLSLKIQLHEIAKEKWDFEGICSRYGLEIMVKDEMIRTETDQGNLSRIDAVLMNHLDDNPVERTE
ncbi:MAG: hypothetical protein ACFFD4_21880 [Candidatus Odinarchaeota archaeon]